MFVFTIVIIGNTKIVTILLTRLNQFIILYHHTNINRLFWLLMIGPWKIVSKTIHCDRRDQLTHEIKNEIGSQ